MNRILKQRAKWLYGANFWKLMGAYFIHFLYMVITIILPTSLLPFIGDLWAIALQTVLLVLISPLAMGVLRYAYLLHREKPLAFRDVFYFFTSFSRYGKAVRVSFVRNFVSYAVVLLSTVSQHFFVDNVLLSGITSLAVVAMYTFFIFWFLRTALMEYILVEDEAADVGHIRKESFRLMKGYCGKFFALNLSFFGWYLLLWGLITVILVIILVPILMHSPLLRQGLVPENFMAPYLIWIELAVYASMIFIQPYIALANAGFADMAIQGRLRELEWQNPQWQQPSTIYSQNTTYGMPYPNANNTYSGQPPVYGQPQPAPFTPAQQEEAHQYSLFHQGQPMVPRTFVAAQCTTSLETFLPWPMMEHSSLYSFLKLANWMPGMVVEACRQAAQEMATRPQWAGQSVQRTISETVSGTFFRVTALIEEDVERHSYSVTIRIDLNPAQ